MRMARRSRAEIEALLANTKLAGTDLAHSRSNNLQHIHRLVNGDPGVTLGIDLIHDHLEASPMQPQQVLELIAGITCCSKDLDQVEGGGYISPSSTYEGLRQAAMALRGAVEQQATILFASGHPRNMTQAYEELAGWLRSRGCEVVTDSPVGITHEELTLALDGSVYVVTRDGAPAHTHDYQPMQELLRRIGPVGIAVADHGFAGATLNLGIPTVCVMDTNDPGVAVAAALGAPVTVVPLNDNSPGEVVREIAGIIIELAEGFDR